MLTVLNKIGYKHFLNQLSPATAKTPVSDPNDSVNMPAKQQFRSVGRSLKVNGTKTGVLTLELATALKFSRIGFLIRLVVAHHVKIMQYFLKNQRAVLKNRILMPNSPSIANIFRPIFRPTKKK
ncbi:hypothetical protein AB2010_001519 [Citrobacter freundii]